MCGGTRSPTAEKSGLLDHTGLKEHVEGDVLYDNDDSCFQTEYINSIINE